LGRIINIQFQVNSMGILRFIKKFFSSKKRIARYKSAPIKWTQIKRRSIPPKIRKELIQAWNENGPSIQEIIIANKNIDYKLIAVYNSVFDETFSYFKRRSKNLTRK